MINTITAINQIPSKLIEYLFRLRDKKKYCKYLLNKTTLAYDFYHKVILIVDDIYYIKNYLYNQCELNIFYIQFVL